ncbi:hypothetical protein [Dethiobacter alkaliphilus]|uniref:DUF5673 domain-containing protein n=1 Tax=Dethiobacter alkaliphilus AHT 1 TaxID=555088 RepID=C0GKG7_DETAL|nr:hypothetical protein [Dethiobacter alkaliphilus]EEG76134.1 hypothetical protein DealDRAFT_2976 [Dethiobacter alkaliphilus AHT 1]
MKTFYVTKTYIGVVGTIGMSIGLLMFIGLFSFSPDKNLRLLMLLLALLAIYCLYEGVKLWFFQTIQIGKEGVEYRNPNLSYKMRWDDIGSIGVTNRSPGFKKWIYFSLKEEPNYVTGDISQDLFVMNYRKSVIYEVQKYWSKEINGLK